MNTPYEKGFRHSQETIVEIRRRLEGLDAGTTVMAVCGSYARREASRESDLDYFILGEGSTRDNRLHNHVRSIVSQIGARPPAPGGPFDKWTSQDEILENIGGEEDSNANITRRMLLLLEGEWLLNERFFRRFRRKVVEKYVSETVASEHLAMFLLNDIIRYYRTVAVDYEFKTSGSSTNKPWATRLLKLVFSRKLLYASGLFSVGMTYGRTRDGKVARLEELFSKPVIERMQEMCGSQAMQPVMDSYNRFLDTLADKESREHLQSLDRSDRDDLIFREIKNEGHRFNTKLLNLFHATFEYDHPIRQAVIF